MGKKILFYAEDDRNEAKLIAPIPDGIGLDGLWTDDYHHQVRGELDKIIIIFMIILTFYM